MCSQSKEPKNNMEVYRAQYYAGLVKLKRLYILSHVKSQITLLEPFLIWETKMLVCNILGFFKNVFIRKTIITLGVLNTDIYVKFQSWESESTTDVKSGSNFQLVRVLINLQNDRWKINLTSNGPISLLNNKGLLYSSKWISRSTSVICMLSVYSDVLR